MIVICPHCTTANRLDPARAGDEPVCGKCGTDVLDGKPVALDDARFERFVSRSELPVVVDFWAAWCGPCRSISPVLAEIANERQDQVKVVKVNIDENYEYASKLGVTSVPTMVVFKGGQMVEKIVGAVPKRNIVDRLVPHLA